MAVTPGQSGRCNNSTGGGGGTASAMHFCNQTLYALNTIEELFGCTCPIESDNSNPPSSAAPLSAMTPLARMAPNDAVILNDVGFRTKWERLFCVCNWYSYKALSTPRFIWA